MAYFSTPAIATDSSSFLTAWVATPYDRTPMLMVQRLDAPAPPLAVVTDAQLQFGNADLVWSNGSYLLIWNRGFELHAMRLDRDGHAIGDRLLANDLRDAVVVSGGATTLVIAHTDFGKNEVVVLTLDNNDRLVKRRSLWSYAGARYDAVARDGGFTVAIADQPGLYAMRFDAAGELLDATPRLIAASSGPTSTDRVPVAVSLASRGSDTMIVWTMLQYQQPADLFAALLSSSGGLGECVTLPHPDPGIGPVDIAADGDGYGVVFSSGTLFESPVPLVRHLLSLRLAADGTPVSAPLRVTSDDASIEGSGRLARSSSGYAVVGIASSGSITTSQRVTAVTAPSLGGAVAPIVLSRGATAQIDPVIASNGSGYLVAWLERSLTRDQIVAVPLDRNGAPAAPPVALFDSHFSYTAPPRVAFSGGIYLVAWEVDGAAWGVRLDAAGRPLDSAPLRLSGEIGADAPQLDVTATPGGFFVVWPRLGTIYGAALTGVLPAPPQKLTEHLPVGTNERVAEADPHIAFNGNTFLLAYASILTPPCVATPCLDKPTWQMIRLDSSGRPLDTVPHALDAAPLAVASDGRDFAIVQFGHVLRVDSSLSIAARLDVGGALRPALVWNGARYVLVIVDAQAGGGLRATAREITPEWTFGGTPRTTMIEPRANAVAAAANAAGDVFLAYARRLPEEPFQGASRAAVQPVGDTVPARVRAAKHP